MYDFATMIVGFVTTSLIAVWFTDWNAKREQKQYDLRMEIGFPNKNLMVIEDLRTKKIVLSYRATKPRKDWFGGPWGYDAHFLHREATFEELTSKDLVITEIM